MLLIIKDLHLCNDFSKMMEDSLARAFVVDGDSTGNANLRSNNSEHYDFLRTQNPKLWFKQFNDKTYCLWYLRR